MTDNHAGREALVALDEVLRERPHAEGQTFTKVTELLAQYRNVMTARHRREPPGPVERRRLEHVNAVISVVLGGHFPLGSVPWREIEKAREWLAAIVDEPTPG